MKTKVNRRQLDRMIQNNEDITQVDTSGITDMSYLFYGNENFNQPIGGWNFSNVKTAKGMFNLATSFNQPIEKWNTSRVKNMKWMFRKCPAPKPTWYKEMK